MADPTGYSPNFVQRVLEMFSPVRAAQDIKRSYNTFSDIVNNRGVTDEQVQDAGMTAGAFGSFAPRPRFPGPNAWPKVSLEAFGGKMSPETKAYLRGVMESKDIPSGDPKFYLHDPVTSRAYREGLDPRLIRRDLSEPRADAGAQSQPPAPDVQAPQSPVQSPQSLGQALQGNAPQSEPTVQLSPRFATPQKNDVVRRMAQGTPPEKFKTPAERKYAKDIANQAEVMGVPVDKMWEAIATGVRKRAWMAPPVAGGAAASSDDEFRRALAAQLMQVY